MTSAIINHNGNHSLLKYPHAHTIQLNSSNNNNRHSKYIPDNEWMVQIWLLEGADKTLN